MMFRTEGDLKRRRRKDTDDDGSVRVVQNCVSESYLFIFKLKIWHQASKWLKYPQFGTQRYKVVQKRRSHCDLNVNIKSGPIILELGF